MNTKKKILIATGGTGGHVIPAYNLAGHFIKKKISVELITDTRGLKFLSNSTKINITINNSTTIFQKNIFKIPISIIVILVSFLKSLFILKKLKPNIVFGMGGHSSFPICLAAKVLRIPLYLYEINLFLGKTNKYLLPFADKIFIAYSDIEGIKNKYYSKKIFVGNIISEKILNFKKKKLNQNMDTLSILVLGGSQAARSFGEFLPLVFENCLKNKIKLSIFQQCTHNQINQLDKKYKSLNIKYELFNYKENLLEYFDKIDFVITRSGASMISELVNCSIPFIAIPYPYAADDHQKKNAQYFKRKGCCFLIEEKNVITNLFPVIKSIHDDKNLLKEMIHQQSKHSDKEVFNIIDKKVEKIINE